MPEIIHFNVSQIRVAATCPRILYFDLLETRKRKLRYPRVSRIWKAGADDTTACGSLFHNAVEAFNSHAGSSGSVVKLLQGISQGAAQIEQELRRHIYKNFVDRGQLFKYPGGPQQAFIAALGIYVRELADIISYGLSSGMKPEEIVEQMFGDRRRRVDVTFEVGKNGQHVHITGMLDYVFYDWRIEKRRIIDYKLTPGNDPSNDLFQVSVYGLMHHTQHNTEPDVAVFYLHPRRQMFELKWDELFAKRYRIYDLLASMVEWADYEAEAAGSSGRGLLPPGEPIYCAQCPYNKRCVKDLGPKNEGQRIRIWEERLTSSDADVKEPKIERADPQPLDQSAPVEVHATVDKHGKPSAALSRNGMEAPGDALWLGRLRAASDTRVTMPAQILATHTAVVGAAGSGKTWLAKVIVEEAILQGIPVVAVDPQGDLVQFLRPADPSGFTAWEQRRFDRYWQIVEPRVFTPGSSHAVRLSLNPLRLPRNDQFAEILEPVRRQEEFEGMLGAAAENLVSLAQVKGELGSQKTFLIKLLRILGQGGKVDELSMADLIAAIRAPEDMGLENSEDYIRKIERERLGRSLVSLMEGPAGQLFRDGLKLDVAGLRRPLHAGKTPLNVIYLNAITDDSKKQFLVASLAAEIYRWMVGCSEGTGMKLLFYIDEARDFLPKGTQEVPAKQPLIRLFTQGRKYGVGCLLCTQSPRGVDYNVFGNCSTKIVGRLGTVQDVDRVDEWFHTGAGAPAWLAGRKGAEAGSFVGSWPEMDAAFEGTEFVSRPLFSTHRGAWSPDRVEREMTDNPLRDSLREKWPD